MASWIGISTKTGPHMPLDRSGQDRLLTKGSLVIETRLPQSLRPKPVLFVDHGGDWPFHLSVQAVPGGGLIFLLNQGNGFIHRTVNSSDAGRTDVLRITFSWDSLNRFGRLAVERLDKDQPIIVDIPAPTPFRMADIERLLVQDGGSYYAPDLLFVAVSDQIEPVGPMPSLTRSTPIATPDGYRPIANLKRGDLVITATGETVPVLHKVSRTVPACGCFKPVRLRAPFFGVQRDIVVAPSQRLVLYGSEVDYLFGQESVLVELRHLIGESSLRPVDPMQTVTYEQLILPGHEPVWAAGALAESLYIGRTRRKKDILGASLLAPLDRQTLPEHGKSTRQVLNAFDAVVLAEQRAS